MIEIATAAHLARLDPITGCGVLVMPDADDDVAMPGDPLSTTLHQADLSAIVAHLSLMGWEPLGSELGDWEREGVTTDGRPVLSPTAENRSSLSPALMRSPRASQACEGTSVVCCP